MDEYVQIESSHRDDRQPYHRSHIRRPLEDLKLRLDLNGEDGH